MLRIHSGEKIKQKLEKHIMKYQCDYCDQKYVTKSRQNFHLRMKHQGLEMIKNHKCGDCDDAFDTKLKLHNHFRIVHMKQD